MAGKANGKEDNRTQAQREGWYPQEYGAIAVPVIGDEFVTIDTSEDDVALLLSQVAQAKAALGKK